MQPNVKINSSDPGEVVSLVLKKEVVSSGRQIYAIRRGLFMV